MAFKSFGIKTLKIMAKQLDYFVHHVYFWLKKPGNVENRMKFEKGLKDLLTIETITGKHLGKPASDEQGVVDSSYSYSLLLTFKSKEDQDLYQNHPAHIKFIEEYEDLWKKIVAYDSVSY